MSDLDDPIYKEIVTARVKLLLEKPFFGNLASRLIALEAPWCSTAATEGKHLFYNREFIKGLSRPKLLFLIAHEVLHVVFDHIGRRGSRDKDLWNMACLAWDTPILMADGSWQPIQRVLPGDLVASPVGPSRVLGNMFSGIKPTMQFHVGGKSVRSTLDHKYAADSGEFLDASTLIHQKRNGYVLNHAGLEGIRAGQPYDDVLDGLVGRDGRSLLVDRGLSRRAREVGEQVFAQAAQLGALSVALAARTGLFGRHRGWGGDNHLSDARQIHSPDDLSVEHVLAAQGLAGGARVLFSRGEESTRAHVLPHDAFGMGNRRATEALAALSRDQAAARADFTARHGDPERAASSWAAAGGRDGTPGGVAGVECARFQVGEGSGALAPVFDLVTEAGSFFANGIVTHNCDYIINYVLVKEKVGQMPDGGLYDEKYTDEMTAYEVYELLKKNSVTIKMPLDEHLDVGSDSQDGDGDDDQDGESGDQDGDQQGNGDGDDQDGDGSGQGNKPGKGKFAKIRVLGKDGPPKLTEADMNKIRNQFRAALVQTAQQVGAGNVPMGVRRMIQQLVEPQLDWRSLLDAHIRSAVKDDYTFQRISRRSWASGAILPAQDYMDRVEIFCAIDASGSTTQAMVTDFLSEVKGIIDSFRDYKIDIVSFDTEVYNHVTITPENSDSVYEYEIKGGGGTMFECVYEYLKRAGIEPHRLAFLTDGLPNSTWGDPEYADTIFIIHSNPRIQAPYGLSAHYEPKNTNRQAAFLAAPTPRVFEAEPVVQTA